MRVLLVSNKVKTYSLGLQNILTQLIELGHEVVWAADFSGFVADNIADIPAQLEQISISTNPIRINNYHAFRQILSIINKYHIEGIYCATPIGGALARLAGKKAKISPVVYAAHGFLFFKGAPLINRTVYKLEEMVLAHYTDALITITKEDFNAACKFKLRSGKKPYLVHGAGVNTGVVVNVNHDEKRDSLGIPKDAITIVSAGELNKNKNTEIVIKALAEVADSQLHYIVCGTGPEEKNLKELAKELNIYNQIHFLGYRTDVPEIMSISDIFVMMSFREGMPRALLEAMDLGLPCVGSNTRGIRDLIDSEGGIICDPRDYKAFAKAFKRLKADPALRKSMGAHNKGKVEDYSVDVVCKELNEVFRIEFV